MGILDEERMFAAELALAFVVETTVKNFGREGLELREGLPCHFVGVVGSAGELPLMAQRP
jgi:hypothetical protein